MAEPIYVSETVEKTMNATFHRMDLDACGPGIMRCERVVVKVWVRREQTKWRVLLEMDVGLGNLQYLGKSVWDHLQHCLIPFVCTNLKVE